MNDANTIDAANRITRMLEEAGRLESILDGDLYADLLMVRAQLVSMEAEVQELLDEIPVDELAAPKKKYSINDFEVGDRVRISGNARPMYLRGAEGVVRDVNRTRVVVKLDENSAYRRYSGATPSCPTSILEKL